MASYSFVSLLLCLCFVMTFLGALSSSDAAAEKQSKLFRLSDSSPDTAQAVQKRPSKLFVFGDSSATTGNTNKYPSPYGITYPGYPTGRPSDGRVSVDFLARYLEICSPISYERRNNGDKANGMNFAYGGAAAIKGYADYPTIRLQVQLLNKTIREGVYNMNDLKSSVAIISYGGNDYSYALKMNPGKENDWQFWTDNMRKVVTELQQQMKTIYKLGVPKVIVNALPPLGCVPQQTVRNNYTACSSRSNKIDKNIHNTMLSGAVKELNKFKFNKAFFVLDYFNTVLSLIGNKGADGIKFDKVYEPCCEGSCGVVNHDGSQNYTVCADPSLRLYWDMVHFSEQGWRAIYYLLKTNLKYIFKF